MSTTLVQNIDHPAEPSSPADRASGKATASLVLGLVGVVGAIVPAIGLPASIIGLVLASKATRQAKSGLAQAGLVLSIIGLAISTVVFVVAFVGAVSK